MRHTLLLIRPIAGSDNYKSAWLRIGLAVRLAQDLQLMTETATRLPSSEQEERRRVFWSIYLLDRLVSCGRSRPPAILDASCRLRLASDEAASEITTSQNTLTLGDFIHRTPTKPDQWSPLAKLSIAAYTLSRAAQYMVQHLTLRSDRPPWDADSDFAWILSDLLSLENILETDKSADDLFCQSTAMSGQIDQHYAAPLPFSRALFHLSYCLLHHPFLLRNRIASSSGLSPNSFLTRAFSTAQEHAKSLLSLLSEFLQVDRSPRATFYDYCALVASTIVALSTSGSERVQGIETSDIPRLLHPVLQNLEHWKCSTSVVWTIYSHEHA